jgi:hypothetical protein
MSNHTVSVDEVLTSYLVERCNVTHLAETGTAPGDVLCFRTSEGRIFNLPELRSTITREAERRSEVWVRAMEIVQPEYFATLLQELIYNGWDCVYLDPGAGNLTKEQLARKEELLREREGYIADFHELLDRVQRLEGQYRAGLLSLPYALDSTVSSTPLHGDGGDASHLFGRWVGGRFKWDETDTQLAVLLVELFNTGKLKAERSRTNPKLPNYSAFAREACRRFVLDNATSFARLLSTANDEGEKQKPRDFSKRLAEVLEAWNAPRDLEG